MAYTEFYCRTAGSNLNAGGVNGGGEPSTTALYTSTNASWNSGTGVFTPTDGSNPSGTVSVGDMASVYLDAATVTTFIGRITAVQNATNGTITLTASGTPPSTGATGRTIKVGGAWRGPNGTDFTPFTITTIPTNSSSDKPRINLKSDQTYSVTAAMTISAAATYQGYTSTAGDLGRPTFDGGSSGASYILLTFSSNAGTLRDLIFQNNGATGSANGINSTGSNLLERVTINNVRGTGFNVSSSGVLVECEAYSCNQSNSASVHGFSLTTATAKAIRCIAHDNTGSNAAGFGISGPAVLIHCIADTNGGNGFNASTGCWLIGCVAYNNTGAGVLISGGSLSFVIENCILANNTTYGVSITNTGPLVSLTNNAFFSNTTSATNFASGTSPMEIGSITLTSAPFLDAPNGDFRLNTTETLFAGRGKFQQIIGVYGNANMLSYPDVGAVQKRAADVSSVSAA